MMSLFLKIDLTGYQVRAIVMVTLILSGLLRARSGLGADHLQSNNCIFFTPRCATGAGCYGELSDQEEGNFATSPHSGLLPQ